MTYFIGYLGTEEVNKYYRSITADLAGRFGVKYLAENVPPHITLKYPFDSDDLSSIEGTLVDILKDKKPIPFSISSFDEFKGKEGTIFLSIDKNPALQSFIKDSIIKLGKESDYYAFGNEFHLHMSIARSLDSEKARLVWEYLKTLPKPYFDLLFDNLTVFIFDSGVWKIKKTFKIPS